MARQFDKSPFIGPESVSAFWIVASNIWRSVDMLGGNYKQNRSEVCFFVLISSASWTGFITVLDCEDTWRCWVWITLALAWLLGEREDTSTLLTVCKAQFKVDPCEVTRCYRRTHLGSFPHSKILLDFLELEGLLKGFSSSTHTTSRSYSSGAKRYWSIAILNSTKTKLTKALPPFNCSFHFSPTNITS